MNDDCKNSKWIYNHILINLECLIETFKLLMAEFFYLQYKKTKWLKITFIGVLIGMHSYGPVLQRGCCISIDHFCLPNKIGKLKMKSYFERNHLKETIWKKLQIKYLSGTIGFGTLPIEGTAMQSKSSHLDGAGKNIGVR